MARKSAFCDIVIDGDTFWTTEPHKIRLDNVCAPEAGSPNSQKAKRTLEGLILNKTIEYDQTSTSYDRIVAEVVVNGMSVNHYMRLQGYTCP
jgi:endonuclease YncB( thermonuclease family)